MRLSLLAAFVPFLVLTACSSSNNSGNPGSNSPVISCPAITNAVSCTVTYVENPAGQPATCAVDPSAQSFALNTSFTDYSGDGATCHQTFDGCTLTRDCSYNGFTLDYDFSFATGPSGTTVTGTGTGTGQGANCAYAISGTCTN